MILACFDAQGDTPLSRSRSCGVPKCDIHYRNMGRGSAGITLQVQQSYPGAGVGQGGDGHCCLFDY
jgi:hypothetical protein